MKNLNLATIAILFTSLTFSSLIFAKSNPKFEKLANAIGIQTNGAGECQQSRKEVVAFLKGYPAGLTLPAEIKSSVDCLALKKNFNHDKRYRSVVPELDQIINSQEYTSKKIRGKIRYEGFLNQKFSYRIKHTDEGYGVFVNIHVKKWKMWSGDSKFSKNQEVREAKLKRIFNLLLSESEKIWNKNNLNIKFHFNQVDNKYDADYSIVMRQAITGSKYNTKWDWWPNAFANVIGELTDTQILNDDSFQSDLDAAAHEIGHMVGLDDEYSVTRAILGMASGQVEKMNNPDKKYDQMNTDKWVRACDQSSIMCKDWNEDFHAQDYHYYLILKRFFE